MILARFWKAFGISGGGGGWKPPPQYATADSYSIARSKLPYLGTKMEVLHNRSEGSRLRKLIRSDKFCRVHHLWARLAEKTYPAEKTNVTFHWSPSAVCWICNRPTVELRTALAGYDTTKLTHPHNTQLHISQMYSQLEHIGYWPQNLTVCEILDFYRRPGGPRWHSG